MKVIKSLNNNMVLASDDNGRECIYKGKGIGFQKKKGDPVEMDKIERSFVPANEEESRHFQQLFSEIPEEYWDMAGKVVEYARTRRKLKITDKVILPLCDHMAGAVERYQQGVALDNPMLWDVKRVYPKEFRVGMYALTLIKESYGIEMKEDEAAYLAYHFVIDELGQQEGVDPGLMTEIVGRIIEIVEKSFQIELNEEDWNYQRFLTHLKFFVNRVIDRELNEESEDQSLFEEVKGHYPRVYKCVERISDYILIEHHYDVNRDEQLYLMMHLERVTRKAVRRKTN